MNKFLIMFLIGFMSIMVCFGSFYIGTEISCKSGTKKGFQCVEPKIVGACKDLDRLYLVPDKYLNNTVKE